MPSVGTGGGFLTLDFLFPVRIHILKLIKVTIWKAEFLESYHSLYQSEEKSCTKCTCALNWENLLFKNDALGKTEREAHTFG